MRINLHRFSVAASVVLTSSLALAQAAPPADVAPPGYDPSQAPPPAPVVQQAAPQAEPPGELPPPASIPPPVVQANQFPPGQWVQTSQYGNVWMPYDQAYTHGPMYEGADPYQYLYAPAFGWRWMPAPWVFGIGPQPYFGPYGYARFGWYGRGYYGHPWYGYGRGYPAGYRGVYVTHPGAYYGGRGYVAGPAYVHRAGPAPAPYVRPATRGAPRVEHHY